MAPPAFGIAYGMEKQKSEWRDPRFIRYCFAFLCVLWAIFIQVTPSIMHIFANAEVNIEHAFCLINKTAWSQSHNGQIDHTRAQPPKLSFWMLKILRKTGKFLKLRETVLSFLKVRISQGISQKYIWKFWRSQSQFSQEFNYFLNVFLKIQYEAQRTRGSLEKNGVVGFRLFPIAWHMHDFGSRRTARGNNLKFDLTPWKIGGANAMF